MNKDKTKKLYFFTGPQKFDIYMDACGFYPPVKEEKNACVKLIRLSKKEVIQLQITELNEEELSKAPQKVREIIRDSDLIISYDIGINMSNSDYEDVKRNIFPGKEKLEDRDKIDIKNLFIAHHLKADFYVTYNKKHLNSKSQYISRKFSFKVVTPAQCLKEVVNEYKKSRMHEKRMQKIRGY